MREQRLDARATTASISSGPTPSADGSRSRAARTSRRSSHARRAPAMRAPPITDSVATALTRRRTASTCSARRSPAGSRRSACRRTPARAASSSAPASAAPQEMPGEHALVARGAARQLDRALVVDRDHLVEDLAVEDRRHEARADPLDAVRARAAGRSAPREDAGSTATIRQSRVARAQHLPHAGDRAAGPDPGDERVDAAVERREDLRAGRAAVHLGVGRVRELVGQEHVGVARELAGARRRPRPSRPSTRSARRARRTGAAARCARGSCPAAASAPARSPSRRRRSRARCPVLPLVASTIVVRPGSIRPSRSAASIIATPMRSFTLPPGLRGLELAVQLDRRREAAQAHERRPADALRDVGRDRGHAGTARSPSVHRSGGRGEGDHLGVGEVVEDRVADPVEDAVVDPPDVLDVLAVADLEIVAPGDRAGVGVAEQRRVGPVGALDAVVASRAGPWCPAR